MLRLDQIDLMRHQRKTRHTGLARRPQEARVRHGQIAQHHPRPDGEV